jgi:uncharacterized protein (TIGR02757 family)
VALNQKQLSLKKKLDCHYRYFDFSQISPDPLEFPHRFKNSGDIEISAFVSALFAYGNVAQIINSLERIHKIMKESPAKFVLRYTYETGLEKFGNVKHRFYTGEDIARFFLALNRVYVNYGSLKYFFLLYYFDKDKTLKDAISFFSRHFYELLSEKGELTPGLKFMVPDPFRGSACKRINLFLRWMVRQDELDFGLWKEIGPSQLVIPVDTHVARICKELKLTKVRNVSWKMAEDITDSLRRFDSSDPVKYDFAICHLGMRKMSFES